MRRAHVAFVVVLLLAGTLGTVGPVAADPPSTSVYDHTEIFCFFGSDVGDVEAYASTRTDSEGGEESEASVFIFLAEEETDVFTANPFDVVFEEGTFTAELDLVYGETGEPAGTALMAGTYEQDGELEIVEDSYEKLGNVRALIQIEVAPLVVAGELQVALEGFDPQTFDLTTCEGQRVVESIWQTNPTSEVEKIEGTDMFCSLEQDGWFVELYAFSVPPYESFLDLVAWGPNTVPYEEEPSYYGFAEDIGLTGFGGLFLEVPLWEPMMEEPTEVATIDAVLSKGEGDGFNVDIRFQDGWVKVIETPVAVEGTLTLPEASLDMSECDSVTFTQKAHFHPDQSQGKGQVPANDLPDGATVLTNRTNVQTRMTAEEPEAACVDPDWGELPLGKTVWYKVEGTGEEMTVDTAGSDFDTIVGVYLMEGDELVQEACLDDNFDESGFRNVVALTFETMPDTTYYVQIGGFDAQYGHLKVGLR